MPIKSWSSTLEVWDSVIGGWRYVFSAKFRRERHREWRQLGCLVMLIEVAFGLFGIVFSIGVVAYLVVMIWRGE